MRLKNIARYFNDDSVYDAYTGALLFKAHTTAHDDYTSSGATSRRRTMRTIVDTVPPARRAVRIYDDFWIVGNSNTDGWKGDQIRRSYGLKKTTGLMALLTPAEACQGAPGTLMHAHKEYYKDLVDTLTESDLDVMWNIFCPITEAVAKGSFFIQNGRVLRVRNTYPSVDEYTIAETDEFDADAAQIVTFITQGVLDLVNDVQQTVSIDVPAIQTDVPKFYQFRTEVESDRKPGDRTVFVPAALHTPKVGDEFTLLGATWRTLAVVPELDSWALHARRS